MKKDFVSLAEARPDLAKEWNYEKNGDLKPDDVSCGSGKKVWWKLSYDVPDDYPVEHLRGKHFEFEWEAMIANRNKGIGCPYLSGAIVWADFNDLATINPELATQWHPTKNGNLKPTQVTANTDKKVWWLYKYNDPNTGKIFEFEWKATIHSRNAGAACPYLNGQAVWAGFNDLATINPKLAAQWHPIKNGALKPTQRTASSHQKIWWLYPYDDLNTGKHFDFVWKAAISDRNKENGCPFLTGKAAWKGFNDLQTVNPELTAQWHPDKNGDLKPTQVTANSNQKVWWLLSYDDQNTGRHFDFEWEATIASRSAGIGCPYLTGKAILRGFNDLATTNPELSGQWHPTKNRDLKPTQVTANSNQKVWWLLSHDDQNTGKHFDFEWEATIHSRNAGAACPYLSGRAVWAGFNDLATINPELAAQWHPTKNKNLKPTQVTANSGLEVWWIYSYNSTNTGRHFDFEWKDTIAHRNSGRCCPYLSGQAVWTGFNDLATINPELAAQWHPTKNGNLKPTQVTANTDKKVWWLYKYNDPNTGKVFEFEWMATIYDRNNGHNCPYLNGQAVWPGFNDLATINPELTAQWHPTKNGNLKPTQVTANTDKKVWWLYKYNDPNTGKQFKFEWKSGIGNRNRGKSNCPYLCGKAIYPGFNDLATINPELAAQWHPTKNGDLKPTQVTIRAGKKVWWLLPYDDQNTGKHFDFEWKATIASRSAGIGCPYLTTYKGEEYIKQYLQKNNISFDVQQKFSDLLGTGNGQLSYDFSIPNEKHGYILIEYNGIQHYEAVDYFGGEEKFKIQKEHDKRKRDYAKKHGYKLITVKYTYDTYESVEEYLDKELKKLGVINDTKKEENVNDAA